MSSPTPDAWSCSAVICWCVVLAGWITSVLASPTLARCEARRQASMNFAPALRPPFTPKETMEPQPLGISFLPSAWSGRSEEHTSELQSLMRISYAVFCLKKKKNKSISTNLLDIINYNIDMHAETRQ